MTSFARIVATRSTNTRRHRGLQAARRLHAHRYSAATNAASAKDGARSDRGQLHVRSERWAESWAEAAGRGHRPAADELTKMPPQSSPAARDQPTTAERRERLPMGAPLLACRGRAATARLPADILHASTDARPGVCCSIVVPGAACRRSDEPLLMKSGASTSVIVASSLTSTCSDGPAVSLNGSPTVSPTTAAVWRRCPCRARCPSRPSSTGLDELLRVVPGATTVVQEGGHEDAADRADDEQARDGEPADASCAVVGEPRCSVVTAAS